jgi:hypothetical protein
MIYVIFILVSYLAASSATIAGFGSSTLLIPVALLFMDIKTTIFIVAFFHLFNNIFKIKMFWSKIDFNTFLLFGIPSIILAFIGAALISVIPVEIIKSILAVFLIIYSIYTLINPKFTLKKSKASAVVGGGFSGLLAGLIGMGGAIRSAFLIAFNLPKEVYIATSAMIAVVIDVTRIPTYFFTKVVQGSWHYIFLFFLFVSAYLGVKTGKILLKRINQKTFRKIVSIVLFLVGVKMLIL